jgi:hypothetical protein
VAQKVILAVLTAVVVVVLVILLPTTLAAVAEALVATLGFQELRAIGLLVRVLKVA